MRIHSREPAETDLTPTKGQISFAPGETEKEIQIFVVQDVEPEDIEKFTVFLMPSSIGGGARLADKNPPAFIVIKDSDAAHGVVEFAKAEEQRIIKVCLP